MNALNVTAGFDKGGEAIAIVLHVATDEAERKARNAILYRALEENRQVFDYETQSAARWLGSDLCECVHIDQPED